MPLRQLKIIKSQKCLAAAEENTAAYNLIQDHLEEVADEETVWADETEVMEQQRLNDELLLAYQDLIDAGQAWYIGGKLMDKAKDLQSLEAMSFEHFIKEYEELRQTIKKMPEQAELQGIKKELSPIVRNLCAVWTEI